MNWKKVSALKKYFLCSCGQAFLMYSSIAKKDIFTAEQNPERIPKMKKWIPKMKNSTSPFQNAPEAYKFRFIDLEIPTNQLG